MYNVQTVNNMLIQMVNTHVHIHIQMSSKNSHPGKRWIPPTTGCKRGWGESWESWMPAWRATERAEHARAKAEGAKKRQEQINTHPDLARIFQRREWNLSTQCGQSAGWPFRQTHKMREVDYSSAPSLTQFGKTQMRGQRWCERQVWECLWLHQIFGLQKCWGGVVVVILW